MEQALTEPRTNEANAGSGVDDRRPPEDLLFRPVKSGNAFEETVQRLSQAVKLGLVPPGARLPSERALVSRMGVSRATLREAIRVLEQAGYLEARRGRSGGTFVLTKTSPVSKRHARQLAKAMGSDLVDALTFRSVIEPGAAELAATVGTAGGIEELRRRVSELSTLPRHAYRTADSRFHLGIAELSGSPTLVSAVADLQTRLSDLLSAIPMLDEALRHSNEQHALIVAAIEARDPAAARRAMQDHIEATATLLHGFLD